VDGDLRADDGQARAAGDQHDVAEGQGVGQNQWPVERDGGHGRDLTKQVFG